MRLDPAASARGCSTASSIPRARLDRPPRPRSRPPLLRSRRTSCPPLLPAAARPRLFVGEFSLIDARSGRPPRAGGARSERASPRTRRPASPSEADAGSMTMVVNPWCDAFSHRCKTMRVEGPAPSRTEAALVPERGRRTEEQELPVGRREPPGVHRLAGGCDASVRKAWSRGSESSGRVDGSGDCCASCRSDGCGGATPSAAAAADETQRGGGCGNGVCSGKETCATCPNDCGPCRFCRDGALTATRRARPARPTAEPARRPAATELQRRRDLRRLRRRLRGLSDGLRRRSL